MSHTERLDEFVDYRRGLPVEADGWKGKVYKEKSMTNCLGLKKI